MKKPAEKLTRKDWVLAALQALARGGIEGVKVDRLAKKLGVSRGSFYWHFEDRADLLKALLDIYESDFTNQLIDKVAGRPTARERLRALVRETVELELLGVDIGRAEIAYRQWAVRDPVAAKRVDIIDRQRLAYLAEELESMGVSEPRRFLIAKAIYMSLLGLYLARGHGSIADDGAYMLTVELLLKDIS